MLIWDAPNLDMGLDAIVDHHHRNALERPCFDALGRWLFTCNTEVAVGYPDSTIGLKGTMFTNIAQASADVVRLWVDTLRNVEFVIFVKPKIDEDSHMLGRIKGRYNEGLAVQVVVSAYSQALRQTLERTAHAVIDVQMIGFREHTSWALASAILEFADLEDIAGVFRESLPRISLDSLPAQGEWCAPFPGRWLRY
ncbi:hypothetical protein JK2ML_2621 [Mycobacterium leprae Kyoto-2]|uniref:NYN domain-containing protein n=4 Tax=Mycobacterium leprae TaxID=1769 RepID=Q9CD00_MYCLE|nr:NYN domain-containing protein [Mycobacterium leprae]OAR20590.1 NYN domain-containing protein [Mycobacterium leprae 3125609]OAX70350.1 NYN domain-containing protein [Mycobacterium leprae 7935681]CAR72721.1 hypothetical protein MLBr02621 [Mycobacterium leprae Br4923]BBC17842.1 hypothetical protein JK2ML_2621 [Mycobacterium leprae Kyoto-2]